MMKRGNHRESVGILEVRGKPECQKLGFFSLALNSMVLNSQLFKSPMGRYIHTYEI
jgi:hypothetical protein